LSIGAIILLTFGGTLAIEGVLWAVFPAQMREMYKQMMVMPDSILHRAGLVSVAVGIALLFAGIKLSGL